MNETKAQHTAGPWRVGTMPDNQGAIAIMDSDDRRIGVVDDCAPASTRIYHEPHPIAEGIANAHLIAAAPALLAAARSANEWFDVIKQNYPEMLEPFKQLRAAIAKATGGQE